MKRRDSQVTITDLFCGAGGWTEGAEQAGALVRYGVNHWQRACDTYELNHPNAKVDCNDISSTNPGRYPRTDILIASPECTTHSPAGGSRPRRSLFTDDDDPGLAAELARIERSRVTMLDVIRFAEHHRYDAILVENVVEVRRWELFDWWLTGLTNLGYEHAAVYMNSMVAWPTPQSRDRVYFVFWRKGNRKPDLRFDVPAWCPKCEHQVGGVQSWKNPLKPWGKYRTQYVYRCPSCSSVAWPFAYPAATAIDWSLPTPRIGDRARPLAEKTMERIRTGLIKYGRPPYLAVMRSDRPRANSVDDPLPTVAASGSYAGLVVDTAQPGGGHVRPTDEPMLAQTARQSLALVVDTQQPHTNRSRARHAHTEPIATQTANMQHALVVPMRQHTRTTLAESAPMPTMLAGQVGAALVVPMTSDGRAFPADREPLRTAVAECSTQALLVPAGGTWNDDAKPVDEPMRARTSRDNEGLLVMRNNDGARLTSVAEVLGTLTGAGHQSVIAVPFLTAYHGLGGGGPVTQPMGVVDTRDRYGLVDPAIDVDDCGFRMLEPHEIKAAMAFPDAYKILGTKREQVKQCGNAVTPPVARMLVPRVIASLQGRDI